LNPSRLISIDLLVSESVSASSLYGLYDVLASVGIGWEAFVTGEPHAPRFRVRIVSTEKRPFKCASGVQISPDLNVDEADGADIVVVPGLTVSATEPLDKSQAPICDWLRAAHKAGARVTAACTGALLLAEAGLLDGLEATTHWAFRDLFRLCYPRVRLRPEKNLCRSGTRPEIVTSGGASVAGVSALSDHAICGYRTSRARVQVLVASGPGGSSGAVHGDAARNPPQRRGGAGLPSLGCSTLRNAKSRRHNGRTIESPAGDIRTQVQACNRLCSDGLRSYRADGRGEANARDHGCQRGKDRRGGRVRRSSVVPSSVQT
jgi:putative intracellular protease/amidase